jgi:methyl-accepting chemotaxis protein
LKTKPKILLGICSPLVLLLILGGVSVYSINSIVETNKSVDHTHEVLGQQAAIVGSAVDMETGMRGYLLAGKEGFLDPYIGGGKATYESIAALRKTVDDNPKQVERLVEVEKVLREWQEKVTEPTIQLRRDIGDADTMNDMAKIVGEARGKVYFDKFREQIATFIGREQGLLKKRRADLEAATKKGGENTKLIMKTIKWTEHTYKVILQANAILSAAVDMETGMRGYLLAGQDAFLAPYKAGSKQFSELSASLQKTVDDNPAQVQLLKEAAQTIGDWQKNVTEPTIALRRKIGDSKSMDDMADVIGQARGKKYFDRFRQVMADFRAEETGLMEQRQADNEEAVTFTFVLIGVFIALAVLVGIGLAWLIGNGIANPITKMTDAMQRLAKGEKSVEIPGTERGDEIGDMAGAVQVFKDNAIEKDRMEEERAEAEKKAEEEKRQGQLKLADDLEGSVKEIVEGVSSAATEMESTAQSMSANAEQSTRQSDTVAAAAEEASTNVQTVASAAEELTSSIEEVGRQVSQSTKIAGNAVVEAEKTNDSVQGLSEAAQKIGEVVELINDIASQTNLLALNATIEAARAGDAGKGFAVVASEVKSLANQTAKATDEIGGQIGAIQWATEEAVAAIGGIAEVIAELDEIAAAIAAAVEEQGAATQEIARNVQEAAKGTGEVSSNMEGISKAAGETGAASGQVLSATRELSGQATRMSDEIDNFLHKIRAA